MFVYVYTGTVSERLLFLVKTSDNVPLFLFVCNTQDKGIVSRKNEFCKYSFSLLLYALTMDHEKDLFFSNPLLKSSDYVHCPPLAVKLRSSY